MNIWKINAQDGYRSFIRIDENGKQIFEKNFDFYDYQNEPSVRILKDDNSGKLSDFMYYFSGSGTKIVSNRFKEVIESWYPDLKLQFLPTFCKSITDKKLWVINAYDHADVLDLPKCKYTTSINRKGECVIDEIKEYCFKKEAFEHLIFKVIYPDRKEMLSIFATDEFIDLFESNGLIGLRKEKVYSF